MAKVEKGEAAVIKTQCASAVTSGLFQQLSIGVCKKNHEIIFFVCKFKKMAKTLALSPICRSHPERKVAINKITIFKL